MLLRVRVHPSPPLASRHSLWSLLAAPDASPAGYEAAFFYESGEYQDWLLARVRERLALEDTGLILCDLGGGTGNFTAALAAAAGLTEPILCVDSSAEMLAVAARRPGLVTRCQDALTFSACQDGSFDRVLLKEVIHHLAAGDIAPLYLGLARQLRPGGLAVTVTRPQEVDYPLFSQARAVWRANQPAVEVLEAAMRSAGFENVRTEETCYRAELPKSRWFAMVRARFWSTFSVFDDAALEAGLAELEAEHQGRQTLHFNDRLLFVIGQAPATQAARGL